MTEHPSVFVDTNVFAYALDPDEPIKQARAQQVLAERRDAIVVSAQVLIELYNVCTRAFGMSGSDASLAIAKIARHRVMSADRDLVLRATDLAAATQVRIFDAMILVAAKGAGCSTVLSEDLNPGQDYDGVRVVNPFG